MQLRTALPLENTIRIIYAEFDSKRSMYGYIRLSAKYTIQYTLCDW